MVSNRRHGLKSCPMASARIPPWLTAASTRGARTPWSALICERFPEREINHKTAVDGHKKAQKAQNEKGGVATGVPDPVRVSARSRKFLNHEWTRMDTNGSVSGIRVHSCSFVVRLVWVAARPP